MYAMRLCYRVKTSVVLESLTSRIFLVDCGIKTEPERAIIGLFHSGYYFRDLAFLSLTCNNSEK